MPPDRLAALRTDSVNPRDAAVLAVEDLLDDGRETPALVAGVLLDTRQPAPLEPVALARTGTGRPHVALALDRLAGREPHLHNALELRRELAIGALQRCAEARDLDLVATPRAEALEPDLARRVVLAHAHHAAERVEADRLVLLPRRRRAVQPAAGRAAHPLEPQRLHVPVTGGRRGPAPAHGGRLGPCHQLFVAAREALNSRPQPSLGDSDRLRRGRRRQPSLHGRGRYLTRVGVSTPPVPVPAGGTAARPGPGPAQCCDSSGTAARARARSSSR